MAWYDGKETKRALLTDLGVRTTNAAAMAVLCEQRSSDWHKCRLGVVTGSAIGAVVTSKGEPRKGQTRRTYVNGLIAERLTGTVEETYVTAAMERGTALEPRAREWYERATGDDVREVGFVYGDATEQYGCSPDGLCIDRAIEIKCLMRKAHIDALRHGSMPAEYAPQVQFEMWVCGLSVCDFILYTPEPQIPRAIWTIEADPRVHAAFATHVPAFCEELAQETVRLQDMVVA